MVRLTLLFAVLMVVPTAGYTQAEVVLDEVVFEKAKVLQVYNERIMAIPGTDTQTNSQTLQVEILNGEKKGTQVSFENDYTQLSEGDVFYLRHSSNSIDAIDYYSVADPYRLDILIVLVLVFILLAVVFGGLQGVRGLASLVGSMVLIFYLLIPGMLLGYSPVLVALCVSSLIVIFGSYVTHGFNRTTSAAVIGMIATIVMTGLAAYVVMETAHLSGFTSDENVYLNFNTRGAIDMISLLFGGILIGLLGVLYDSAIGQAIAVEELFRAGTHMRRAHVYARAIRIGREHIGALINTLAIAYVGASLPLFLLISHSSSGGIAFTLNSEIIATEIIRILIGSIGLILSVPVTTLIATHMLADREWQSALADGHSHHH